MRKNIMLHTCNRCGEEVEASYIQSRGYETPTGWAAMFVWTDRALRDAAPSHSIDLCTNCYNKFKMWMEEESQ